MTQVSVYADPDDGQDRRRSAVDRTSGRIKEIVPGRGGGKDKRDCKQEEVRDGVRGNQSAQVGDKD